MEQVLRENESRWEALSDADRERVGVMARAIVNRLLHEPTLRLKARARTPTSTCTRCASCSTSKRSPRAARRRGHGPRGPPPPAQRLIRLGTRGSALALAQASLVAELLDEEVELVPIKTSGDRDRLRLRPGGDKARFVKEIEEALLAGEVDLAVHSAKDVPSELPEGLSIVGVPARADARDALCGAPSLASLAEGAVVGTGSLRRRAQLLALRPDLEVRTGARERGHSLAASWVRVSSTLSCLRCAGLERLGPGGRGRSPSTSCCPPPGQGCLALEARDGRSGVAEVAAAVTDRDSLVRLTAERALVQALDASCHTPLAAHATLDGDALALDAFVGLPDGSTWLRDSLERRPRPPPWRAVAERMVARCADCCVRAAPRRVAAPRSRCRGVTAG